MVARLLRAELYCENPCIEERRETHHDDALAFGVLISSHLGIGGRKKRMNEGLAVASGAPGEGAVTGLDGVVIAAEEIIRPTQTLRCQDVAPVKAKHPFKPRHPLRGSARPHQNISAHLVTVDITRIDLERAVD